MHLRPIIPLVSDFVGFGVDATGVRLFDTRTVMPNCRVTQNIGDLESFKDQFKMLSQPPFKIVREEIMGRTK